MRSVIPATLLLMLLSAAAAVDAPFNLKNSLPKSFAGNSWKQTDGHTYTRENLYNYIDGAADHFIAYGFIQLAGVEYRHASAEKGTVIIDVYDMGSTLSAFGIFRSKRDPESKTLQIGAGALASSNYIFLYKDRYYVEIQAYTGEEGDILRDMAQTLAGILPGQNTPPSELNYLPARDRVPGTELYITGGILGHGFLDRGLVCNYRLNGEEVMAFLVFFPSPGDAAKALESYKRYLEGAGEAWQELKGSGESGFMSREPYHKTVMAARKGAFIAGIADLSRGEKGMDLLMNLLKNVPRE